MRYFVREDISHGVTKVLYAISRRNSMIKPHNNYSSLIASTITIGFGGSVGTEATIVLNQHTQQGTPDSHFLKRISDFRHKLLNPYIHTDKVDGQETATNAQNDIIGHVRQRKTVVHRKIQHNTVPAKIGNPFKKVAVGGALLGVLIYAFPPLYGEGYSSLQDLLTDNADNILKNTPDAPGKQTGGKNTAYSPAPVRQSRRYHLHKKQSYDIQNNHKSTAFKIEEVGIF